VGHAGAEGQARGRRKQQAAPDSGGMLHAVISPSCSLEGDTLFPREGSLAFVARPPPTRLLPLVIFVSGFGTAVNLNMFIFSYLISTGFAYHFFKGQA
jgi:hypothetical protein